MDFAAATPIHKSVLKEMVSALRAYGNPSAPHEEARASKALLEDARKRIARCLTVKPESLIFTGSGTQANNLAILGVINALIEKGAAPESLHIITSSFEHPSVSDTVAALEAKGVQVSYAQPNEEGIITPEAVKALIKPETVLVSIVAVQSEIGQIQPLKDISRMLESVRKKREQHAQKYFPESHFPLFHSDACQTPLFLDLSPDRLGVDMATYDAQKIMGPKGIGLLYKDSSITLAPLMYGGKQEKGLMPGTENVANIVGMARAFELANEGREVRAKKVSKTRDYFLKKLEEEIPEAEVNGGVKNRIANNVHISIPGIDGDYLTVLMDTNGVAVNARYACLGNGGASSAVVAIGKGEQVARGTLRFTFGPDVSKGDVDKVVTALKSSSRVISQKFD